MTAVLPINNEILKWARETQGLSIDEVVEKLGRKSITADTISEWECGNGSPNYPQLEQLAYNIYHRPLAVFFFPSVPVEGTVKTDFRTLPEVLIDGLPPTIIKQYRKGKLFQLYLDELYDGTLPGEYSLLDNFSILPNCHIESFVSKIRKVLGISIDEQMQWHSPETAFKMWREAFEKNGIYIFKDAFKNDDYSGFCLHDQKYPLILVNNSMPHSRQVFTLFHELSHLLYGSSGIDFRNRNVLEPFTGIVQNVEVFCNKFANEFLVPKAVFDSFKVDMSEENFQKLANIFSVSREVILRNYLDRRYIDSNYYDQMITNWSNQRQHGTGSSGGGNYYYTARAYLGDKYINLVYGKYYQNKISENNVAEYLNVKVKNLSTLEHVVIEGGRL